MGFRISGRDLDPFRADTGHIQISRLWRTLRDDQVTTGQRSAADTSDSEFTPGAVLDGDSYVVRESCVAELWRLAGRESQAAT